MIVHMLDKGIRIRMRAFKNLRNTLKQENISYAEEIVTVEVLLAEAILRAIASYESFTDDDFTKLSDTHVAKITDELHNKTLSIVAQIQAAIKKEQ